MVAQFVEPGPKKGADSADITAVKAVKILDEELRKTRGGDRGNQYTGGKSPFGDLPKRAKSNQITAAIVGTSSAQVGRARAVYNDPIAMQEVEAVLKSLVDHYY